jgi:hypothetical protein
MIVAAAATLWGCTHPSEVADRTATCSASEEMNGASAIITGGIRYAMTIGAVTEPGPTWETGAPRAGVFVIDGQGIGVHIKQRTNLAGTFTCHVPPGRYRVSAYIPGVYEQGYTDEPLIHALETVDADEGQRASVHLFIYEWWP